jgi:hypothetical protein
MNRLAIRGLALPALVLAALAVSGCTTVSVVNNGFKTVNLATRIVSSTGDVLFDHNGNGR